MFYLIETHEQLIRLSSILRDKQCFIKLIPLNNNYHPAIVSEYGPSLLYIKAVNDKKGYLVCIKHNECLNELKWEDVINILLDNLNTLSYNVKELMYYGIDCYEVKDIYFCSYEYRKIYKEWNNSLNKCIEYYYNKYPSNIELNCLIPLSKHYEYCEELAKNIQLHNNINSLLKPRIIKTYYNIEKQGISIDKNKFIQYYSHIQYPEYNIKGGKIYTYYNLYTLTGRPSNSFNGINFMALNKENGERSTFIPENSLFVEFDYKAFHIAILSNLIKYKWEGGDPHNELGKQYFNKTELTEEEYNQSKTITFSQIYGGIKNEYKQIPFFRQMQDYIDNIWDKFQQNQSISTPIRTFISSDISDINQNKLLNYIIQSYETSVNVEILLEVLKYLENKQSNIVLYVYDSYLIDLNKNEQYIIEDIKNIIKQKGYNVSVKMGKDYQRLSKM